MRSLSSFNRGVKILLCVVNVFTKNAVGKPLEDEKDKRLLHSFVEIVKESKRQPYIIMG